MDELLVHGRVFGGQVLRFSLAPEVWHVLHINMTVSAVSLRVAVLVDATQACQAMRAGVEMSFMFSERLSAVHTHLG